MRLTQRLLIVLIAALVLGAASAPAPSAGDAVLAFLDQTIDWYRQVSAVAQTPVNSQELVLRETVRSDARQVVHLGFDFARAEAAAFAADPAKTPQSPTTVRGKTIGQTLATASQTAIDLRGQLDAVNRELAGASDAQKKGIAARRDKIAASLNLTNVRVQVLTDYQKFMAGADGGLAQRVDDLESSVPETKPDAQKNNTTGAATATQDFHPESSGIFGLASEILALNSRLGQLNSLAEQAQRLFEENDKLRLPIRADLQAALRYGEQLSATQPTDDPDQLTIQKKELDTLAERFKMIAAASVPLGEQSALIKASRQNLLNWHRAIELEYNAILRALLFRVGVLIATTLAIIFISELWRRATFRYVQDVRRRRQLMMVRRTVVGVLIVIIVIASFVTEFQSLATFAGLITAGVAVALQTVILSGVAYFFFIGRFGVRVGDRVTISGVTGDVVELGLFRLYLMELTGGKFDLRPTGRVVVFSNAVLFQSSAFYKQLPGADYIYHELTFTLATDANPHLAEKRLMAVVEGVYGEYKESIERQHSEVTSTLHVSIEKPHPESRLKFINGGVEFSIRFPVEIHRANEIDDKITRRILEEIDREPKLKLAPKS
jgi:small-conductance mechanosensitive channel